MSCLLNLCSCITLFCWKKNTQLLPMVGVAEDFWIILQGVERAEKYADKSLTYTGKLASKFHLNTHAKYLSYHKLTKIPVFYVLSMHYSSKVGSVMPSAFTSHSLRRENGRYNHIDRLHHNTNHLKAVTIIFTRKTL